MVEILIFAAIAAVVLFQLYNVLGKRVGRQPEDEAQPVRVGPAPPKPDLDRPVPAPDVELTGLAAVKAADPAFDPSRFLDGARSAYQMIVEAFAEGDKDTLRDLLSPSVFRSFEGVIDARAAEGRTERVEFQHPPRVDVDSATVEGDTARVKVRYLAEFRSRTKGPEGEAVDDKRTAELWTYERNVRSSDPNWRLSAVEAAQA